MTFSATVRSSASCVARYTTPMPPRPATVSIRWPAKTVPGCSSPIGERYTDRWSWRSIPPCRNGPGGQRWRRCAEKSGGPRNRTSSEGFGDHPVAVTPVPPEPRVIVVTCAGFRPSIMRTYVRAVEATGQLVLRVPAGCVSRGRVYVGRRPAHDRLRHGVPEDHRGRRAAIDPRRAAQLRRRDPTACTNCVRVDVQLARAGSKPSRSTGQAASTSGPSCSSDWQQAIVDEYPWTFLRGLLHSDGCRTINRFKTKLPSGRVARVRVSALVLLEPVGRHPRAVLRDVRAGGRPLDAVQRAQHLGLAPPQRRAAGRARGAEDVTRTMGGRCGRGGIGRHAGLRSRCRKAWGFESLRPHSVVQVGGASATSSLSSMRCSPSLTRTAWKPRNPPSLAAFAASRAAS